MASSSRAASQAGCAQYRHRRGDSPCRGCARAPPTLRLYGWSPPALTLGRGQPCADADVGALERDGIDLVRRMTGGTAVLNRDELTYTIAVADSDPRLAGTIAESYRAAGVALVSALARLGLMTAEIRPRDRGGAYSSSRGRTLSVSRFPRTTRSRSAGASSLAVRRCVYAVAFSSTVLLPLRGDIGAISAYLTQRPDPERIRSLAGHAPGSPRPHGAPGLKRRRPSWEHSETNSPLA